MPNPPVPNWPPTAFHRFVRAFESSTQVARIATDAGDAYLKALGPHICPHKLACELLGTQLAQWLGLPVFEFAILNIKADDEIPLKSGRNALLGPGFVTRAHRGIQWSGAERILDRLDNPDDISRLVVLDTWTLNWDRHSPADMNRKSRPDNVFFSEEGATRGRYRLIAMDQSECFADGPELNARMARIGRIQDERIFGLFPQFIKLMKRDIVRAAVGRMAQLERRTLMEHINGIPRQWDVSDKLRAALADLILGRAGFLADKMDALLAPACWPQGELDFDEGSAV